MKFLVLLAIVLATGCSNKGDESQDGDEFQPLSSNQRKLFSASLCDLGDLSDLHDLLFKEKESKSTRVKKAMADLKPYLDSKDCELKAEKDKDALIHENYIRGKRCPLEVIHQSEKEKNADRVTTKETISFVARSKPMQDRLRFINLKGEGSGTSASTAPDDNQEEGELVDPSDSRIKMTGEHKVLGAITIEVASKAERGAYTSLITLKSRILNVRLVVDSAKNPGSVELNGEKISVEDFSKEFDETCKGLQEAAESQESVE